MKISPVQLKQMVFKRVHVDIDEQHTPDGHTPGPSSVLLFDGVNIATGFGMTPVTLPDEPGLHFMLSLRVVVDNQAVADEPEQQFSPYLLDLEAAGVVTIPPGAEQLAPPEDLAAVNGAGLLWSAIREQVLVLTARMPIGQAMLPTVNFHDLKKQDAPAPSRPAADAPAAATPVRKRAPKSKAGAPR